jgi:hypothetical protein
METDLFDCLPWKLSRLSDDSSDELAAKKPIPPIFGWDGESDLKSDQTNDAIPRPSRAVRRPPHCQYPEESTSDYPLDDAGCRRDHELHRNFPV